MLKKSFLLFLAYSSLASGMEKDPVSTQNYSDDGQIVSNCTIDEIIIYDTPKKINLHTIISKPKKALLYSNKILEKMASEGINTDSDTIENIKEMVLKYKALVQKYETQSPVFLLGECKHEGKHDCILSRIYNANIRKKFEKRLNQALTQKLDTIGSITYTSFGCGGKFQDLVIATKFLAKKPTAKLDIHLIDITHDRYTAFRQLNKQSQEIIDQELNLDDLTAVVPKLTSLINQINLKEGGLLEPYHKIAVEIMLKDLQHKEFLNWLKTNFPQATIRLFTHESAQSYKQIIDKGHYQYPDILCAADIQDNHSLELDSMRDYGALCIQMLSKKPQSINLLLAKNPANREQPCFITYALQSSANAQIQRVDDFDGNKQIVFLTKEDI